MTDWRPPVVRVFSGRDSGVFLGTGVLAAPDWVLTCKHVMMETDPFGQPTDQPLANVSIRSAAGERVDVARIVVDDELDLAVLLLERPLDIAPPLFVWGLTKAMESVIHSCPLTAFGYAQGHRGRALWQHELRDLRFFYTHVDETLTEVQSAGGIPAGCSGGPVLLRLADRALYIGTVYLGGERSATSRVIAADPVARFLNRAGVPGIGRIDAPRALSLAAGRGDTAAIVAEYPQDPRKRPNPYRGLASFREIDAPYFFGRRQETETLCALVKEHRLVSLVGASGSGKSSLVHAGLVPTIRSTTQWHVALFRPRSDPFKELATCLCSLVYQDADKLERLKKRNELEQNFKSGSLSLADIVEAWAGEHADLRLLLVADQFEELYARNRPDAETVQFINALLLLVETDLPCTVLLSFRADFMGAVLSHGPMADTFDAAPKKILGPMDENAQRAAIIEPARQLGVRLESGLAERIMSDVGGEPGNLPLLEFALAELWEKQTDGLLTHAAYSSGGAVLGALAHYADGVVHRLRSDEGRVRQVVVQLVQPGEGGPDLRRVAKREQIGEANWSLLNRLADSRLVITDRNEDGEETAEIVHEALIRHWPRLGRWVDAERRFRTWQERLRQSEKDWKNQNRDDGALLRGARLTEAEEYLRTNVAAIGDAERRFIETSMSRRAEEMRAQSRSRVGLFMSLSGGLIVAIGLSIWANHERQEASVAQLLAVEQKEAALEARAEAEKQRSAAQARQLAAQAELILERDQPDIAIAALLATESLRRERSLEAYLVWEKAMRMIPRGSEELPHDREITDAKFSPDGARVATASWDKTARLWDLARGSVLHTLDHPDEVLAITFSSDGARIATASSDAHVRIWDADDARQIADLPFSGKDVTISFSPSGDRFVAVGGDGIARIWDAEGGLELHTLDQGGPVDSLAYSENGHHVAIAASDGTARVWEINSGHLVGEALQTGIVRSMSLNDRGNILATNSGSNTVAVWDVENGRLQRRLKHDGLVLAVAQGANGRIATASSDASARIWDAATGKELFRLTHDFWVTSVAFSADGNRVATASGDRTARVWDTSTGHELFRLVHEEPPREVLFSPDGRRVLTIGPDHRVRVWSLSEESRIIELVNPAQIIGAAFSADGGRLVTASKSGKAIVWDSRTGKTVATLNHRPGTSAVAINGDGAIIAMGGLDGVVVVWDAKSRMEIARVPVGSTVFALALNHDASLMATATDQTVRVWDLSERQEAIHLPHGHMIWSVIFDSAGQYVATAGSSDVAMVWDAKTGKAVSRLHHEDYVWGLAFAPDGSRIATASQDGFTRVWDLETGREQLRVSCDHISNDLAFSPNGAVLAAGSLEETVCAWDTRSGKELARIARNGRVGALAFSPSGSFLLSAGFDTDNGLWRSQFSDQQPSKRKSFADTISLQSSVRDDASNGAKVWLRNLPWKVDEIIKRTCSIVGGGLSVTKWQEYLGTIPYEPLCANAKHSNVAAER